MAVALSSCHAPTRDSPRSCSLYTPRHGAGHASRATPSLRTTRTDPDLGLDDFDFSYLDAKATWGVFTEKAELDSPGPPCDQHHHLSKPGDLAIPSIKVDGEADPPTEKVTSPGPRPFQKWMRSLHKRAMQSMPDQVDQVESLESPSNGGAYSRPRLLTRKSSSGSSFAFITEVHSASISLASASLMAPKQRRLARSSHGWTERSSRASTPAPRFSEESYFDGANLTDDEAFERSLQRRRILEELLSTEANYISDVRFLMNVYITILASLPTQRKGLRQSINRNLNEIVELHQEMLGELHRSVPSTEFPVTEAQAPARHSLLNPTKRHHRWYSLDSVDEHRGGETKSQTTSSLTADPEIAAEVARIFGRRVHRFFIYEEYGAKYEMMIKDVASANEAIPGWESYQRGLEALAASLGSEHQHLDDSKKSLTVADLLVKPIQRVCRYPLLFSELLKYTPACDCPGSQMEIEGVLFRLREATAEINRATDDPDVKVCLERTWLLQDRLVYPSQTWDAVEGEYMVSLLYKDRLCLAIAEKGNHHYTIRLCISLNSVRVEEVDNGQGLQCHTAPFSWKLMFEYDCQLYEIIMTACNPKEEMEWRSRLTRTDPDQNFGLSEATPCDSMSLSIKSLGTIFGKPGTIARRVSIQRATTVGSKSPLCQVVLKNTTTVKDSLPTTSSSTIGRSQSLLTTNPRNTLAPALAERLRLEALLADIWSRESLPFPGMSSRSRSELLVRSSASTVMRKLSVASISSSFTKRSATTGSTTKSQDRSVIPRTSYGDTASRGDMDGAEAKLPMIKDEFKRSNTSLPHVPAHADSTANATQTGSMRRFKSAKSYEVLRRGEGLLTLGSPILRTASINSARQGSLSAKPLSTCTAANDTVIERTQHPTTQTTKPGKKWARVKTINRGFKASGLRSLFR
ncbi:hypothetical protein Micbo1qcDRAFT_217068 [Microdochium bolleyi]|uniref:DH domain-containing protein n=1 Tax=Microdochium bolleyi TaxID=196109 RepID=A0A136JDX4_9PEZI|nr:hypothetical protein Micbo1qcDRAFT_217068 [Microdochium bolleyi]